MSHSEISGSKVICTYPKLIAAPTPVGMVVHCDCELTAVEDRRLHFTARVYDDVTEIAAATHERYIVDNERFTRKANSKLTAQS